jgi:mRNA interferase HigB
MHVIATKTLRLFWETHPDAEASLSAWREHVQRAHWRTTAELKNDYPGASIVGNNRVVFDIRHTTYRLVVRINYASQTVFICFIGTHKEYNKIDASIVRYGRHT